MKTETMSYIVDSPLYKVFFLHSTFSVQSIITIWVFDNKKSDCIPSQLSKFFLVVLFRISSKNKCYTASSHNDYFLLL